MKKGIALLSVALLTGGLYTISRYLEKTHDLRLREVPGKFLETRENGHDFRFYMGVRKSLVEQRRKRFEMYESSCDKETKERALVCYAPNQQVTQTQACSPQERLQSTALVRSEEGKLVFIPEAHGFCD